MNEVSVVWPILLALSNLWLIYVIRTEREVTKIWKNACQELRKSMDEHLAHDKKILDQLRESREAE